MVSVEEKRQVWGTDLSGRLVAPIPPHSLIGPPLSVQPAAVRSQRRVGVGGSTAVLISVESDSSQECRHVKDAASPVVTTKTVFGHMPLV